MEARRVAGGEQLLGVGAGSYIDLEVAPPAEMGGSGAGTNPEQLFAAGYAACFHGALHAVARGHKVKLEDSSVGGRVQIGPN
ncbi:OsmC family protein, partial [uncultured Microbacterium sp.]|uniref:OsmC family protein n=1 Tax=uncultured Microbacterium sp. TaxID=191216 RepID=UPI0025CE2E09